MAKQTKFEPRALMEMAVEVMRDSIREERSDGVISPKVGAVLWKPDGTVHTAFRGELRQGDHAEYTLIERKNSSQPLDDCILFATLEPCGPNSRNHPKIGCARRITNARIRTVYFGREDPHPKVAGEGLRYLEQMGVEVIPFDRDLQEEIKRENADFFEQAQREAESAQEDRQQIFETLQLDQSPPQLEFSDLDEDALSNYGHFLFDGQADAQALQRRLAHQGLLVENEEGLFVPTGYAHLLFGKNPRDVHPQAGILATLHRSNGEELEDFDGPMVLGPDQVIAWLRNKLPDEIDRTGAQRKSVNDAFYEMIREGLANAIVHRDYSIEGCKIQVVVEGDTITIRSPGAPVEPITLEQLQSFSARMISRNPRMHAVFSTMELSEERGLGLKSMGSKAGDAGLPLPKFSFNDPYLDLTIYRTGEAATQSLTKETLNQLSKSERKGWEWISGRASFTSREYMEAFDLKYRTAMNHINRFEELKLLAPEGEGRARRYLVRTP